jgi:L-alanine-DL-glutamate epimerase-like enolase superfamily enzyme
LGKNLNDSPGAYDQAAYYYASWAETRTPEERSENACRLVEEGFKALKMRIHDWDMMKDVAL